MSKKIRLTKFNKNWLDNEKYKKWIAEHTLVTKAKCKVCLVDIDLSNMGECALNSHAKGYKHQQLCETKGSISTWLKKSFDPTSTEVTTASTSAQDLSTATTSTSAEVNISSSATTVPTVVLPTPLTTNLLGSFLIKDDVMKAEILWTLNTLTNHQSYKSTTGSGDIFKVMFHDSVIAHKFQCGPSKMAYVTTFGLAPYFEQKLYNKIKEVPCYSVSFDESFNTVTKNEQMDFSIRFWDEENRQIVNRYLGSQFLGHTTAKDLLENFNEATKHLDCKKILQISMDGPNVNLKFYENFITERETNHPQAPDLIDIGSCSLHVVHGAFKTAFDATGWNLGKLLKSLGYLFKDSPARREDYRNLTGSHQFPLPFCGTRWIEDCDVAERAILIWGDVTIYVKKISCGPKKNIPKCASFNEVSEAAKDPLIISKLSFFVTVAKILKPFLTLFQSEKPLVPFLGKEVGKILKSLMESILKKNVFPENQTLSSLFKVDIDKLNDQLPLNKVYIGFSAKSQLSISEINSELEISFRKECVICYMALINKLRERSPLTYEFIRQICCLNLIYINSHPNSRISKFESVLTIMLLNKYLKGDECDKLRSQYKDFIRLSKTEYCRKFAEFNGITDRLDDFLSDVIVMNGEYVKLWDFFKMILTLSHGQASIERGFSINKNLLSTNMHQRTVVAQRIVCDGVASVLGKESLDTFHIDKDLLASVRISRKKYDEYLKEQKAFSKENEIAKSKSELKTKISTEKKLIENLEKSATRLEKDANILSDKAENEAKMSLLIESNKSRKRSLELKEKVEESKSKIKKLEKKLKELNN